MSAQDPGVQGPDGLADHLEAAGLVDLGLEVLRLVDGLALLDQLVHVHGGGEAGGVHRVGLAELDDLLRQQQSRPLTAGLSRLDP